MHTDLQTPQNYLANAKGVLVFVDEHTGRVSLKTDAFYPVNIQYTFRNVEEAEDIFNKSLDSICCYDLVDLTYDSYLL
jgi:hypothetical protein